MAKVRGAVVVNQQRCKGCNLCGVACPTQAISLHPDHMNDKGYHYCYMSNPEACIGCTSCGMVCPDGCISVYKVTQK